MSAIHLVVRPSREQAAPSTPSPLLGLLDFVVDGVNITARLGEGQAFTLLAEVAHVVASLSACRRERATVELYAQSELWEIGFEADGEHVLVTVFRSGRCPEVVVHERRLALADLVAALLESLDDAPVRNTGRVTPAALLSARRAIGAARPFYGLAPATRTPAEVSVATKRGFGVSARAAFRNWRPRSLTEEGTEQLERADLHALLVRGSLSLAAHGRRAELDSVYLFLFAEQFLLLAEDVLEAWGSERPIFRRVVVGGARLGVRRGAHEKRLAVSFGPASEQTPDATRTFPEITASAFVRAATRFARELVKVTTLYDSSQARNLRLSALSRNARALRAKLAAARADDSRTNPEPDSYRSFGSPPEPNPSRKGHFTQGGKMRFLPRWVATVPEIDLRATFLCGDLLLVGSARRIACLQRQSGSLLWRRPAPPASSVVTPRGLLRLQADGTLCLHELATGEVQFTSYVAPRPGRGPSGAVVHAPGLPKLVVLAEGERSLTAIDLISGDIRWRYTARQPANFRMRRAGKLLIVSGGDSALVALDVVSGDVVWRLRDRLPFSGDMSIDRDTLFAVAGGPIGPAKLFDIDVWSGERRWVRELAERPMNGQVPLVTPRFVVVATRDRRGVGVCAFQREMGDPAWAHNPGLASPITALLAVDDAIVVNSAAGALMCLDSATGITRYNHLFPRHIDAEQSRRLEPVLRGGALFVPQHQVHVVRPRDGEILGTVPSDLIPDLLRVDERCDVYIAEQSGHLAAFGAAPRLTLVKSG